MSAMLRAIEALSLEDRTRFETKSMLARQIQTSAPTKNLDTTMPWLPGMPPRTTQRTKRSLRSHQPKLRARQRPKPRCRLQNQKPHLRSEVLGMLQLHRPNAKRDSLCVGETKSPSFWGFWSMINCQQLAFNFGMSLPVEDFQYQDRMWNHPELGDGLHVFRIETLGWKSVARCFSPASTQLHQTMCHSCCTLFFFCMLLPFFVVGPSQLQLQEYAECLGDGVKSLTWKNKRKDWVFLCRFGPAKRKKFHTRM